MKTDLFKEVGYLVIVGLEVLEDEVKEFEGEDSVDVEFAVDCCLLFDVFEGEEEGVGDPVDHVVVCYNG